MSRGHVPAAPANIAMNSCRLIRSHRQRPQAARWRDAPALRRLERWATRLTENDSYPFDDLVTTKELSDFRHPCPVKLLDRSLPREASGDDPRGRRVGMISTTALGRLQRFDSGPANGRNRRIFLVGGHPGEGRFTEPRTAAEPGRRQQVLMPRSRHSAAAIRLLTTSSSVWPGARHRDRDEIATDLSHQRPSGEPEKLASCCGPTRMMVLPFNEYRRGDHVRI